MTFHKTIGFDYFFSFLAKFQDDDDDDENDLDEYEFLDFPGDVEEEENEEPDPFDSSYDPEVDEENRDWW